jgi:hypothetical protein
MRYLAVSLLSALIAGAGTAAPTGASFEPTHRQADVLKPAHGSVSLTLQTFVLDADGNITAAVSPRSIPSLTAASSMTGPRGWLQVYSPKKELLREIPLTFAPSALALTPDGHYLIAGEGQLCKCTPEGKIVAEVKLLTLLNVNEAKLREEVIADHKRDQAQYASSREEQLKVMRDQLARLEAKPAAERTQREESRIRSMKMMIQSMGTISNELSENRIAQLVLHRLRVPSIAAAPDGVIVTLYRNRGYEVWRTGPQFEKPRRVLGDLRGCCGQMDVITAGERIITAENTKFRVGIYDLEGKNLSGFGERYQDGNNGFGSCCNPMNVLCCPNGDLLTAESSIGHIKRFNADGKLLALIGRARIGGGCKHVALGFDEKRDRYYVQYQDMHHICVMLPNAEAAPLVAEQDKKLDQAKGAALKLTGKWVAVPSKAGSRRAGSDEEGIFEYVSEPSFDSFTFKADHSLSLDLARGGGNPGDTGFRRWYASSSEGGTIHMEIEEGDGYVEFTTDITLKGDDLIEMKLSRETKTFQRQK